MLENTKRQIQDLTLNEEIKQPSVNINNIQNAKMQGQTFKLIQAWMDMLDISRYHFTKWHA